MSDMPGSPRLALSTVCLSGTLEDKLRAAAAAGFAGVEMLEYDLVMSPWSPRRLADEAAGLGLSIEVYQPFHVETVPPDLFGGRGCVTPSGSSTCWPSSARASWCAARRGPRDGLDDDDLAAEQLHALAGRAEQRGLRLAYEAVPWGRLSHARGCLADRPAGRPSRARAVSRQLPCAVAAATIPAVIAQVPGRQGVPRPARGRAAAEHGRPRVEPPPPDVPRPGLARRGGLPPPGPGHGLRRPDGARGVQRRLPAGGSPARRHRRDALHARARGGGGRARPGCTVPTGSRTADLPPAPELGGFAFAELAVDEVSAPLVSRALAALGFAHVGQHRSMPVQLWEQGAARVLLNLAPQRSIAPATASICALAVESSDPAASMRRAEPAARPEAAPASPTR